MNRSQKTEGSNDDSVDSRINGEQLSIEKQRVT